jgi:hypothetical protein
MALSSRERNRATCKREVLTVEPVLIVSTGAVQQVVTYASYLQGLTDLERLQACLSTVPMEQRISSRIRQEVFRFDLVLPSVTGEIM